MNYITEKLSLKDKTCTCMTHSYLKTLFIQIYVKHTQSWRIYWTLSNVLV